jgi:nicotinamidase-related amidase
MNPLTQDDYLTPITADNAAVLFIDNQNNLLLGVQSIDTTLLRLNTEGLAKLAEMYRLPVVLTTTGGGADGPWGPLLRPITDTFPAAPIINRKEYVNAMDDVRFADAVRTTGRKKLILSGVTTDFCLLYPALALIREGYHVFIATDAAGCWTKQIDEVSMQRLTQAGATPTNVQQIAGELQSATAVKDLKGAQAMAPLIGKWFARYGAATSVTAMSMVD